MVLPCIYLQLCPAVMTYGNRPTCHSLLSTDESPGLSGLNADSQQAGDYNGDSECVFIP